MFVDRDAERQPGKQAKGGLMDGWMELRGRNSSGRVLDLGEWRVEKKSHPLTHPPTHFLPSLFSVPIYPPARLTHLVRVRVRGINPALVHVFGRRARMRHRHRLRRR